MVHCYAAIDGVQDAVHVDDGNDDLFVQKRKRKITGWHCHHVNPINTCLSV